MPTHRALIQPKPVRENIRLDAFEQAQRESPPNVPRWRDHVPVFLFLGGAVVGVVGGWIWRWWWG